MIISMEEFNEDRQKKPATVIPEARVLELIEASEAFPTYGKWMDPALAFHDVAVLLRELLERRTKPRS